MSSAASIEAIHQSTADSKAPDYVIDIVGLSKQFKRHAIQRGGYSTLKSSLLNIFRPQTKAEGVVTNAVHDLTIRIRRGASVGIIGRNGSGKSTLLKLITGIYKPTRGKVSVQGRVAALIELGAGFHPDFTGRENLYLGGVMHGLTRKQIDQRFDAIVEFAELQAVIDDPIRTYSSGMFMRLGFSLAIHTDPDLLIIDEVLAVGDAAFTAKCKERITRLRREGITLLLVSHDLDAIERWCDEAVWLHEGVVKDRGDPRRVIDHYREFIEKGEEGELKEQQRAQIAPLEEVSVGATEIVPQRWGSREIEITSVRMLNTRGEEALLFHPEDGAIIQVHYQVHEKVESCVFGIGVNRTDGVQIYGSNTHIEGIRLPDLGTHGILSCVIDRVGLLDGSFTLDIAAHREDGYPFDYQKNCIQFVMRSPIKHVGVYLPTHRWEFNGTRLLPSTESH